MPLWPVFALCVGVLAVGAVALSSARWRRYPRFAHLLEGFAALERSPRFAAKVLAWSMGTALTRLGAVAALSAALGLPHPLLAALVICPALDLASAIPLTPGNVGVASGAVAVALQSRGIGMTQALGVGITDPGARDGRSRSVPWGREPRAFAFRCAATRFAGRWAVRVAALGLSIGLAALVGTLVLPLSLKPQGA